MPVNLSIRLEKPKNTVTPPRLIDVLTKRGRRRIARFAKTVDTSVLQGRETSYAIAGAHGMAVKRRVAKRGKPVDRAPRYSTKGRKYINPAYPADANPDGITALGTRWYESSAKFHRQVGAKIGSYHVSGGMWDGESVVPGPGRAATLKFRGRSQGQDPNFGTAKQQARRKERGQAIVARDKGKQVSNALKAWTVAESHDVHVLRATDAERKAFAAVVEAVVAAALHEAAGGNVAWTVRDVGGDRQLLEDALRIYVAASVRPQMVKE